MSSAESHERYHTFRRTSMLGGGWISPFFAVVSSTVRSGLGFIKTFGLEWRNAIQDKYLSGRWTYAFGLDHLEQCPFCRLPTAMIKDDDMRILAS
jgi:hypothetical protein